MFKKYFIYTIDITDLYHECIIYRYILSSFFFNAGEAFLYRLTKRRVKIVDLINDLEEEGFSNFFTSH